MAKNRERPRKITTDEALEQLLGRKAAKRIRQIAEQLAQEDDAAKGEKKSKKKR